MMGTMGVVMSPIVERLRNGRGKSKSGEHSRGNNREKHVQRMNKK